MSKQRQYAAEQIAERLFAAEEAVDEAISRMAELTGYMPRARKSANLSAILGQDALSEAAASLSALVDAREHLVATHQRLAETRDQIGLRVTAMGSGDMKPPILGQAQDENIVSMADHVA